MVVVDPDPAFHLFVSGCGWRLHPGIVSDADPDKTPEFLKQLSVICLGKQDLDLFLPLIRNTVLCILIVINCIKIGYRYPY